MDFDGPTLAYRIHFFVRLALDVHLGKVHPQHAADIRSHLSLYRAEFGAFQNDGGVEITNLVARVRYPLGSRGEKNLGVLAFVKRVGIGKELADVGEGECAQECIGDGVVEGISIAMGDRTVGVGECNSTDHKRTAIPQRGLMFEAVEIVTMADAEHKCKILIKKAVRIFDAQCGVDFPSGSRAIERIEM